MRSMSRSQYRRGISLLELCIASALTLMLGSLMVTAWSIFGTPAMEVISRSRIATEIEATSACLMDDLGGGLHTNSGRLGPKERGQLVGWIAPDGAEVWLCFDGGTVPNGQADWQDPDTIVSYSKIDGSLIRWDQSADVTNTVARYVKDIGVTIQDDRLHINLEFEHRRIVRSISYEAIKP